MVTSRSVCREEVEHCIIGHKLPTPDQWNDHVLIAYLHFKLLNPISLS